MRARRALLGSFAVLYCCGLARAEEAAVEPRFADVQVRSEARETQILLGLPQSARHEDQSKVRPGKVVAEEVRLFFPGAALERARLVTVGDRIVEEVRLFAEGGGVVMTVVVRRPVGYAIERTGKTLRLRLQPAALFAVEPPREEPTERVPLPRKPVTGRAERGREGRGAPVQGSLAAPKLEVPELRGGEGLTVDAANMTYDREANEVVAQGRVTIARAGSLLTADEVRINRETKKARASGHVQLTDPQGSIRADSFDVDLDDETGVLTNGEAYVEANQLTLTGSKFEKSYGQTYHIENGSFTTCRCGVGAPSWSIAGKEVDVTLDGYGIARSATFNVLDVPVLYMPIMAFPAKLTRQSGLLAPQVGFSQKRGFTYLQPLYLVINKSADATVSVDVETEARLGGIAEYRYALDPSSYGSVNGSFFDESLRTNAERDIVNDEVADTEIPNQRWGVTADAAQELALGVNGFAEVLAVSDDFFLREIPSFSFDPQYERNLRTSRFSRSKAGLYRLWDRATLVGEAVYYQDFIQEDDLTLQRLPQVHLFASERFLDRRLKLRFAGEGVNFARNEGFDGPRLDLYPQAEVPYRWQEYLRGSVGAGFRETAYHLVDDEIVVPVSEEGGVREEPEITDLGTNPTRELLTAHADIGTEVHRIFEVDGEDVKKLKHTIEPGIEYLWVPDVDQEDQPSYDFIDRINPRSLFTYGVSTRLLAKLRRAADLEETQPVVPGDLNSFTGVSPAPFDDERTRRGFGTFPAEELPEEEQETEEGAVAEDIGAAPLRGGRRRGGALTPEEEEAQSRIAEWAKFTVSQGYDLDESVRKEEERHDHLSDVDVSLRVTPSPSFSLLHSSSIDVKDEEFSATNFGFLVRDPRERRPGAFLQSAQPAALGLSYRFVAGDLLEEIDGSLLVPLADSLSTFYQTRYDALAGEFLENRWGFRLISQCRCWILDLWVSDRINPNETEVRAQVTLVGLGSIGRSPSSGLGGGAVGRRRQ